MPPYSKERITKAEEFYRAPIADPTSLHNMGQILIENTVAVHAIDSASCLNEDNELDKTKALSARLHMIDAVREYIDAKEAGMDDSELERHQRSVFPDIKQFLENPPLDTNGEPLSRGYIKLPTSTGKTALFATLANVFNKKNKEHGQTLKGLVLVPRLDHVSQTIGEDGTRGFARFGPETELSEYHGTKKDLEGETVIMTYQSMIHAVKSGVIDEHTFDYIICDEAHRSLGEVTLSSLQQISKDKIVIALTATLEFAENKKVQDFYEHCIHTMDFHEAIEQSLLAPDTGAFNCF